MFIWHVHRGTGGCQEHGYVNASDHLVDYIAFSSWHGALKICAPHGTTSPGDDSLHIDPIVMINLLIYHMALYHNIELSFLFGHR